jgi:hypothetical protein
LDHDGYSIWVGSTSVEQDSKETLDVEAGNRRGFRGLLLEKLPDAAKISCDKVDHEGDLVAGKAITLVTTCRQVIGKCVKEEVSGTFWNEKPRADIINVFRQPELLIGPKGT